MPDVAGKASIARLADWEKTFAFEFYGGIVTVETCYPGILESN